MGCEQADIAEYSTPEAVYETYRQEAKTLRVVADHRSYRRAIQCFLKEERDWFEEHYNDIDIEKEEEVYNNLYRSKQLAYVMGRSVIPAGPSPDEENYSIEKISDFKAKLTVNNYPEEIVLIKKNDNWVFESLFDVKADDR